ncbi:Na(+)-translocating NADH-quinone reductase subunit A [Flavimarina sp. Hel_I_48]|uniref:Na(+)-translocating NADH-quinone reductase subunit A n=1 Tax=Flavimarina sp. Hel_I_48 TaxID=1392488 RepID=UPI0004DF8406|nr:Na(+)-translocating NADH-quinone reductase subunit A [Flavimarina sp. Hel_I_48]
MSKDIKIKRGLDIKLVGEAEKVVSNAPKSKTYTIKPSDLHLVTPKMMFKEGGTFNAGDPIFYSKSDETIKFVSPVSGILKEIKRGAKRVITHIVIEADGKDTYADYGKMDPATANAEQIKQRLLSSGLWPFIKQRPYDIIADTDEEPRDIFISGYNSGPLAPDLELVLKGKKAQLQAAVTALSKLTEGAVHIGVPKGVNSVFSDLNDAVLHGVSGPHPSGNVGTQINKVGPVNKGETVWTISAADLVIIGEHLLTGKFNPERIIAVSGSCIEKPKYYRTTLGSEIATFLYDAGLKDEKARLVSGNVLTGERVAPDGNLGYYHNEFVAIPEGDDYEFFGWNKPVFNKISPTRALTFSWLSPNKKYDLDTNTNGEHRAFVVTGIYEEVFPLDIFPLQLLKACMVEDLDAMEQMGMYEVAPEDFALTEFICISKQPHQAIIRKGLDLMQKEIG